MNQSDVSQSHAQVSACVALLERVYGPDLLGAYLYGSAVAGGLQRYSDIDVLAVIRQPSTKDQHTLLVEQLLWISGLYGNLDRRPIELTVLVQSEVRPWQYPPRFDFLYGEWLREYFEAGDINVWPTKINPDLSIVLTKVLLANQVLCGPSINSLIDPVPYHDFMIASVDGIDQLVEDLGHDTRNALLTLARMWCTLSTNTIQSKVAAADWAIEHLPTEHRSMMERARAMTIGELPEDWSGNESEIAASAHYMAGQIRQLSSKVMEPSNDGRSIQLM